MPTTDEVERHFREQPPPGPQPGPPRADACAILSIVFGVFWFAGVGSLLAIIFGAVSCAEAGRNNRRNSGLAVAGIWFGGIGIIAGVIFLAALAAHTGQPASCDLSNPAWPNC